LNLLPRTLFGRTAASLLAIFIGVQGIALGLVWTTVVEPLAERSADDLAARMILVAQTWVELPPATRTDYEIELSLQHGLELGRVRERLAEPAEPTYFSRLLEERLQARTGQDVRLKRGPDSTWTWLELDLAGNLLRIGFQKQPYELEAPLAAGGAFLAGALLTLLAALVIVRRTTVQLRHLARSAAEVGQGRTPVRLAESGAEEIRDLNAAFNQMADEVQALLENRTVLLSGISHDLRTPLTRMRLALSMLDGADVDMVRRMEGDLEEMNRLVSEMLDFSRSLKAADLEEHDISALLDALARDAARQGGVHWISPGPCPAKVGELAFRRIIGNLLANAQRYGGEQAVELRLQRAADALRVQVLDRGPGIPAEAREAVFRPFYRLEASRARHTGGSGLGLAIARQLADAYGWRILLDERPGGGLCAELVIPASPD
jgi:two-component system osmolarity sensor histidine kinase EnvZ